MSERYIDTKKAQLIKLTDKGLLKVRDQVIQIPGRLQSKVYKPPEFAKDRHIILLEYQCVTCNHVRLSKINFPYFTHTR